MKSIRLDDLLMSIARAVCRTNAMLAERDAKEFLARFSMSAEEGMGAVLEPQKVMIDLPQAHVEGSDLETPEAATPTAVPLPSLMHANGVRLDELVLEFDCLIQGLESDGDGAVSLLLGTNIPSRTRAGKLTLRMAGTDPPEGVAQVNDQLLKTF